MKGWEISVRTTDNDGYIIVLEDDCGDSWEYVYTNLNKATAAVIRLMGCTPEQLEEWTPDSDR